MNKYRVYHLRTGIMYDCSESEFEEVKKFYKLFKRPTDDGKEVWWNRRMDISVWELKE